jgi:chemotaxis protein MotB
VFEYLRRAGIDSQRMRLSVAGSNEPLKLGEKSGELTRNARVEVFMLDEVVEDLHGTPDERKRRYAIPQQSRPPAAAAT